MSAAFSPRSVNHGRARGGEKDGEKWRVDLMMKERRCRVSVVLGSYIYQPEPENVSPR